MRILLSLMLLLAVSLPLRAPTTALAAADCQVGTPADSLGLIEEAFDVLTLLFVERPAAPDLLQPATDAAVTQLEPGTDDGPILASVNDWSSFADQYCAMWTPAEASDSDTTVGTVAYPVISAMVAALDEGHTNFLTPQMYDDHKAWQAGDQHYEGIGARLGADPLTVQHVFPNSPAEAAGVQFGDQIVAIDGEPATDMKVEDAVQLIRGEGGTTVTLSLQRSGIDGTWDVPISRSTIYVPTIESKMLGNDIAYLHIDSFPTSELPADVEHELDHFKQENAKALVLDLRDNSGGRLDVGTQIAGFFLPPRTPVYQQTTRRGATTTTTSSANQLWKGPTIVLINDGTASMGEILAAALQEGNVATVVGTPSAGEVAGSIVVPLSDGSAIQVTTLRIDSGKGTVLNNVGVQPNMDVEPTVDDARTGKDIQLDAAVSQLQTMLAQAPPTGAFVTPPSNVSPEPAPPGTSSNPNTPVSPTAPTNPTTPASTTAPSSPTTPGSQPPPGGPTIPASPVVPSNAVPVPVVPPPPGSPPPPSPLQVSPTLPAVPAR